MNSASKVCFSRVKKLVSADTSSTERIWSFRGKGFLQRTIILIHSYFCELFQMLGSSFLAWPLLFRGFIQVYQMGNSVWAIWFKQGIYKELFFEWVFQRNCARPIRYLC